LGKLIAKHRSVLFGGKSHRLMVQHSERHGGWWQCRDRRLRRAAAAAAAAKQAAAPRGGQDTKVELN